MAPLLPYFLQVVPLVRQFDFQGIFPLLLVPSRFAFLSSAPRPFQRLALVHQLLQWRQLVLVLEPLHPWAVQASQVWAF